MQEQETPTTSTVPPILIKKDKLVIKSIVKSGLSILILFASIGFVTFSYNFIGDRQGNVCGPYCYNYEKWNMVCLLYILFILVIFTIKEGSRLFYSLFKILYLKIIPANNTDVIIKTNQFIKVSKSINKFSLIAMLVLAIILSLLLKTTEQIRTIVVIILSVAVAAYVLNNIIFIIYSKITSQLENKNLQ